MNPREPESLDEDRLARLLGAGRAPRDAATLTRALARVRATGREPAWLAWLARPAALVAAGSLLVVSVVAGAWYGRGAAGALSATTVTTTGTGSDLLGSLLADETPSTSGSASGLDSGAVQ